ncbi:MAG: hypothetical protein AB8G22_13020 [Saprospiraceae bacterium]
MAMRNGDWENYKKVFWNRHSGQRKKFVRDNPEIVAALEAKYKNRKEKCPQCGKLMIDLGLDFKAPKKNKIKEWEIVRGMYRVGVNFQTCGCSGIGYVPKKEKDYIDYLKCRKAYFLQRIENRDAKLYDENLQDYLNRFTELVQLIDLELEKVTITISTKN